MILSGDWSISSGIPFSLASHVLSFSKGKQALLCVVQVQLILPEARRGAQRKGVSEAPPSLEVNGVTTVLSNVRRGTQVSREVGPGRRAEGKEGEPRGGGS